ncbi:MAG: sel1 repeat family protein [Rhodospirillales bacterium]|nr:sel1 repeat family protein [Rhodospirillales bacterium]
MRSSVLSPWLFVLATALNTIVAAVLAVLITLGVVRQGPPGDVILSKGPSTSGPPSTGFVTATAPPPRGPNQIMSLTRATGLLPIGSPDRPLQLQALKPARLPLQIQPEEAQQETFILVLSGLPPKTSLSGAERMGSDSWLLPPNSIGKLDITVPEGAASPMEVGVELRRTNGVIAARSKAWIVVPLHQRPALGIQANQAVLRELAQRGDQLLGRGDVVAARALYERAAEMGSGRAALALGSTFDPNRLWSLGVFGMVGNKERAQRWYMRADQLGHPEAKARLEALGN